MRTKGSVSRYHLNSPVAWRALPGQISGESCNGLARAGLHSIRISSAYQPGDFPRGQSWEASSPGSPFLKAATRVLLLANYYLIALIIQMTSLAVNGPGDENDNTPKLAGVLSIVLNRQVIRLCDFFFRTYFHPEQETHEIETPHQEFIDQHDRNKGDPQDHEILTQDRQCCFYNKDTHTQ